MSGGPDYYREEHIQLMLDQLKTDRIDCLVVHGLENFGCSPFVRGWRLDELVARTTVLKGWTPTVSRRTVADLMLRFAVFQPFIDRLIVAIRRREWIGAGSGYRPRYLFRDRE